MVSRPRARNRRQGRFGKGICKLRQGNRSPEQRSEREGRSLSRVAVSASLLSGSASSPPGTGLNLRWRPLIHPRNAATHTAATLYSDCGGGLVPEDAESMGREDKP